jgi:hypothetical protein
MTEAREDVKDYPFWKSLIRTGLPILTIGLVFLGVLLQHGKNKFDEGHKIGQGDAAEYARRLQEKDEELAKLGGAIQQRNHQIDSLENVIVGLNEKMTSKVIISDTIIYEQDAIALFGGQVTIFERGSQKDFYLEGGIGAQSVFEFGGKKYLVVVVGCREYDKGPGVKIAVYKY